MTALVFNQASGQVLRGFSLELGPGVHIVLGRSVDGTAELIEFAAGLSAPRSGLVRVMGGDPYRSPTVRRGVAALLPDEMLAPGGTVQQVLGVSCQGMGRTAPAILEAFGLQGWEHRPLKQLTVAERRSLALAVALSIPQPKILVLFEPLAGLPGISRDRIRARIQEAGSQGICVVVATSSDREAQELGGPHLVLDSGRWRPFSVPPLRPPLQSTPGSELLIRCAQSRALAAQLVVLPEVTSLTWCPVGAAEEVRTGGPNLEALSLRVVDLAAELGITLESIAMANRPGTAPSIPSPPPWFPAGSPEMPVAGSPAEGSVALPGAEDEKPIKDPP